MERSNSWMLRSVADALGPDYEFLDGDGDICNPWVVLISVAEYLEHMEAINNGKYGAKRIHGGPDKDGT